MDHDHHLDKSDLESDLFRDIVDSPESQESSFDRLHRLFCPIACATKPMDVTHHLSAFLRVILLTATIHDDLTVVAGEDFLDLCCTADRLAHCTPVPGMEPWTWSEPSTFLLKAPNFSQYWTDVALFQRNRANVINVCSGLMNTHESRLKNQTCRMYNPDNLHEANGLRSLLQFLHQSNHFSAREYIEATFGDIISHRNLPPID